MDMPGPTRVIPVASRLNVAAEQVDGRVVTNPKVTVSVFVVGSTDPVAPGEMEDPDSGVHEPVPVVVTVKFPPSEKYGRFPDAKVKPDGTVNVAVAPETVTEPLARAPFEVVPLD